MRTPRRTPQLWSTLPHLASMIVLLALLWVAMNRVKDPALWSWVNPPPPAPDVPALPPAGDLAAASGQPLTPDQTEEIKASFATVTDRTPMRAGDMSAYWTLMQWSQDDSFENLTARARRDVFFTNFWETPQTWRGELVTMRLHVRRVLSYEAPENSLGLKQIYEAWGWTDESRSFPYVVVFADLPEGMTVGPDVREEVTFTGFFLKVLGYQAADNTRGAPLLIGRVLRHAGGPGAPPPKPGPSMNFLIYLCGAALIVSVISATVRLILGKKHQRSAAARGRASTSADDPSEWLADVSKQPPRADTQDGPSSDNFSPPPPSQS